MSKKRNFEDAQKVDFRPIEDKKEKIKSVEKLEKENSKIIKIAFTSNIDYRNKLRLIKFNTGLEIQNIIHDALDDYFKKHNIK